MKLLVFSILLFGAVLLPTWVSAHVLKTDRSIGSILHVEPDHSPIVGEVAFLFFDIKDREGKFELQKCLCELIVSSPKGEIYKEPLTSTTASVVFPEKNIYKITLVGKPASGTNFQNFKVDYDVRVERNPGEKVSGKIDWIWMLLPITIGLVIIVVVIKTKRK
jgi:hypothetical protein